MNEAGPIYARGTNRILPKAAALATPWIDEGLALEREKFIDEPSSLEIKRLLYMTDRRIRYASMHP